MPKKEYIVKLTDEERTSLIALTRKGTLAARKLARAHILRCAPRVGLANHQLARGNQGHDADARRCYPHALGDRLIAPQHQP